MSSDFIFNGLEERARLWQPFVISGGNAVNAIVVHSFEPPGIKSPVKTPSISAGVSAMKRHSSTSYMLHELYEFMTHYQFKNKTK